MSPYAPKDVFLIVLTVLKHGASWNFLARMFQISSSFFKSIMMKFLDLTADKLNETIVVGTEKKYLMQQLVNKKKVFKTFLLLGTPQMLRSSSVIDLLERCWKVVSTSQESTTCMA